MVSRGWRDRGIRCYSCMIAEFSFQNEKKNLEMDDGHGNTTMHALNTNELHT